MMARVKPDGRLFECQEEHDAYLINEINCRVDREDELIILGDFAWSKPGRYRALIHCKHVRFVLGNHDKVQATANVFGQIPEMLRTKVYDRKGNDHMKVVCSHYPQIYWDGSHRGWGHLYGHTHGQREDVLDDLFPQRRSLDVGVDNVYRVWGYFGPVSEVDVYEYLARRSGHDDVRFYDDYQIKLYMERNLI